jgi:hypothetical protein
VIIVAANVRDMALSLLSQHSVGAVYTADEGLHEKLEVFGKTIQADIVAGDAQG